MDYELKDRHEEASLSSDCAAVHLHGFALHCTARYVTDMCVCVDKTMKGVQTDRLVEINRFLIGVHLTEKYLLAT